MAEITDASIHAFYLFDVAQEIRLDVVREALATRRVAEAPRRRAPAMPTTSYVNPPVATAGEHVGLDPVPGRQIEVRFYDYGVISLRLTRPFAGDWTTLGRLGSECIENEQLEQEALQSCNRVADRFRSALVDARQSFLTEDYLALVVTATDPPLESARLVVEHGHEIAQFLRGEVQVLSDQEREEVLSHRLSYLRDDLVVPTWNAAFIYDTAVSARATLEVLELVNSQLLEFRYHDDLLENELGQIYTTLQRPHWGERMLGRRYTSAARRVHALFIDVNELTDRVENAVKVSGDVYAARLINLAAARLGLDAWKTNVQEKLKTLDDIYRFAVEQTGISQANLLELVIVLILVIELGLLLAGLSK